MKNVVYSCTDLSVNTYVKAKCHVTLLFHDSQKVGGYCFVKAGSLVKSSYVISQSSWKKISGSSLFHHAILFVGVHLKFHAVAPSI